MTCCCLFVSDLTTNLSTPTLPSFSAPLQFECRKTYGRVAQGRVGPTIVLQAHVLEVTSHAKSVGDGLASEIKNKVMDSVKGGFCSLPGTRGYVLLLAQLYPKPLKDAANKSGIWSASRIIYGYYSDQVLEGCASQDFGSSTAQ